MTTVDLVDYMGSDLTVVNAARVSLDKQVKELREADLKLIQFLAQHKHSSPFRHVMFQFRITAPEFIARQAYKHNVGINASSGEFQNQSDSWNEMSMRYVTMKNIYVPQTWRKAPEEKRQGSSVTETLSETTQAQCMQVYQDATDAAMCAYTELLKLGVAREMARIVLPLSIETSWIWTMSLQAVVHFVKLRKAPEAQLEIQEMAEKMEKLVAPLVPHSWKALMDSV